MRGASERGFGFMPRRQCPTAPRVPFRPSRHRRPLAESRPVEPMPLAAIFSCLHVSFTFINILFNFNLFAIEIAFSVENDAAGLIAAAQPGLRLHKSSQ